MLRLRPEEGEAEHTDVDGCLGQRWGKATGRDGER